MRTIGRGSLGSRIVRSRRSARSNRATSDKSRSRGARALFPLLRERRTTVTSRARHVLVVGGWRGSDRPVELAKCVEGAGCVELSSGEDSELLVCEPQSSLDVYCDIFHPLTCATHFSDPRKLPHPLLQAPSLPRHLCEKHPGKWDC
ncbi:uncharacterized protein [Kogia breviceps]|uniref:uncharacterized protein isoform X2 n=1 Tax=Kogia breviceps TaxID=27615 RepID=UPI0034D2B878